MTDFIPLRVAVLTVSDTRTVETDKSGAYLKGAASEAGHQIADYAICIDDVYKIRAEVSAWIADASVDVVLLTGGTGFSERDVTKTAVMPLLDTQIDGFGELFRQLSFAEIGTSTIQSRAVAGVANNTVIFALPGSTGACKTAWNQIIAEQLDSRHRPCNFAQLVCKKQ